MPQMAPLKWLSLFFIFSITFIIFNTLNYFIFTPINKNSKKNKIINNHPLNWKW
uniref:ATP synthase complex subunit 8 n=1 Tax=Paradelphomyia sp. ZK-2016 TaxID=1808011 RepID=A0A192U5R8_9DIPT|nr:ATP synthase F0 subunit 8 [Paradelphomyia sp. ZK-2016]